MPDHLIEAALRAAQRIEDKVPRAQALAALAPQLPERIQKITLLSAVLSTFWAERRALLSVMQHLFSALAQLEGAAALGEVERAVRDTGRWFP